MAKNLKSVIFLLRTILLAHKCTLTLTSDFWRQGLPTISRNSHGHKLCSSIGFLIFIFIKKNFFKSLCRKSIKHLLWPSNQRLNILMMFTYWQQNINKNRNSKHKFSTGIIIYWIFKIIMCEMFFNHNPFIYTAMFSNFRCITTGIASLLSVHFVGHQKANDVIESCSARLASPSF